ncbi:MAG: VWA domain-containing protein [Deltaproteobacteria bacterium]|nr:VWA domain-containing protein [Deltaproteobacteria bacterium]
MVTAHTMSTVFDPPTQDDAQRGGRLVTTEGVALPLTGARLAVDARGGLARVTLTQTFVNAGPRPVHVEYLLPLPADGAVSGFAFTIGTERVVGQVDTKAKAKARYDEALIQGRTAALLEQTRSSLFQQKVGNIPAGETVEAEITVDQPLKWLDDTGAWQWRFPTVVGPRYMGAPGRVSDAADLRVDLTEDGVAARMGLSLMIRDEVATGGRPRSPSHRLHVVTDGATQVRFADEDGARLNKDVVVEWPVAALSPGVNLDVARPTAAALNGDAFGLVTLVPPAPGAGYLAVARDLVVLIDTSGSMGGEPLAQAQRVVGALIDTLVDQDHIELIAFDFEPRRFREAPIAATAEGKKAALAWLNGLHAGGGTEMHRAVQEALRPLRGGAQRQVVLVTDGYIGFEAEIVAEVRKNLPPSCRLHTVGVGSSVNRSLTQAAARAGAGLEVIVAPGEDAEPAARRLVARTDRPVVTELVVEGPGVLGVAPVQLPDLYAGAPAQIAVRLSGAGGSIRVRGRTATGTLDRTLSFPGLSLGEGPAQVAARFARERVEDLEAHLAAGGDRRELDKEIEAIGLGFQIATRLTSWVAVSASVRVKPGEEVDTVVQPHEVPEHVSLAGLGLRAPGAPATLAASASMTRAGTFGGMRKRAAPRKEKAVASFELGDKLEEPLSALSEASDGFRGGWDEEAPADDMDELQASLPAQAPAAPPPPPLGRMAAPAPSRPASPPSPEPVSRGFTTSEAWGDEGGAAPEVEPEPDVQGDLRTEAPAEREEAKKDEVAPPRDQAPASPGEVEAVSSEAKGGSVERPGAADESKPAASEPVLYGGVPKAMPPETKVASVGGAQAKDEAPRSSASRARWRWVLLVLVLAALLWWFFGAR